MTSLETYLLVESAEEAAFIKAIFDDPTNQFPKLVFADWLDDRADPFADVLRASVAHASPTTRGGKDDPFFAMIQNAKQYGAIAINNHTRSFEYQDDGRKYGVWVTSAGAITRRLDRPRGGIEVVDVNEIKPAAAKRSALILMLDCMVDAYRHNSSGGMHNVNYRLRNDKANRVSSDVAATWADHAAYRAEDDITWLRNMTDTEDDRTVVQLLTRLIDHTLRPTARLVAGVKFKGDRQTFARITDETRRQFHGLCATVPDLCAEYDRLCAAIMNQMTD